MARHRSLAEEGSKKDPARKPGAKRTLRGLFLACAAALPLSVFAALPLSFSFNASAAPATPAPAPSRLSALTEHMSQSAEGQALLAQARAENVTLRVSTGSKMDADRNDGYVTHGLSFPGLVVLNGDIASNDDLTLTLAHELRHTRHYKIASDAGFRLTPEREWLFNRFAEADGFAYEVHFAYEYQKETGRALRRPRASCAANDTAYDCLFSFYKAERDQGTPAAKAYEQLVGKALRHVAEGSYDGSLLAEEKRRWKEVTDNPARGALYASRTGDVTADADFVAAMRKLASLDGERGLPSWTDADILSLEKAGGMTAREKTMLEGIQKDYQSAVAAWKQHRAPGEPPPAGGHAPFTPSV